MTWQFAEVGVTGRRIRWSFNGIGAQSGRLAEIATWGMASEPADPDEPEEPADEPTPDPEATPPDQAEE